MGVDGAREKASRWGGARAVVWARVPEEKDCCEENSREENRNTVVEQKERTFQS